VRRATATLAIISLLTAAGAACGRHQPEPTVPARTAKIGVILPDSKSSPRWQNTDQPLLQAALTASGIPFTIQNAQGDPTAFRTIANQMLAAGVTVLIVTSVDPASGHAVLAAARARHVATIDYDRLTVGGSADYYVGFDNVQAGRLLGSGLAACLADRGVSAPVVAELDGSPTDYNATLAKQGYDSVLGPRFRSGSYVRGPDQAVPGDDPDQATTIFAGMLDQVHGQLDGVAAASDSLAGAAISVLRSRDLAGAVAVTGQDATADGLREIMAGAQCMTVYKPIKREVAAAVDLARTLAAGQRKPVGTTITDPQTRQTVPAVVLLPITIDKRNLKDAFADGQVDVADVCTPDRVRQCRDAGIG
jgi:D-xylose transport system substrate-binding protein